MNDQIEDTPEREVARNKEAAAEDRIAEETARAIPTEEWLLG